MRTLLVGLRVTDMPDPAQPTADPDEPLVTTLRDPDGHLIELVQWPEGHADGITADDFTSDGRRGKP